MSCFNDLILYTGALQGGCQGWTPLARGPLLEGAGGLQNPCAASPDEYLLLSLAARGGGGGRQEWGRESELKKKKKCSGGDSSRIHPSVFHQGLSQDGGGPAEGEGWFGYFEVARMVVQGCAAGGPSST